MTHIDPNERADAPHGDDAPPPPKPVTGHPTPTADDPGEEKDEEQAAHEATREADDNPSN